MPTDASSRHHPGGPTSSTSNPRKRLRRSRKLPSTSEDRRHADLLDRIEGHIEANPKQTALLGEIRRLLAPNGPITVKSAEHIARAAKNEVEVARRASHLRSARPRS